MADLTQNPEFQKFMQQYSGGQKAQPTTPQFVPQVPQATQGPLMANDPRAVPMMGEWEVQGAKPGQFPLGIPEDKLIPQPVTNTPQVEPEVPQVDRGEFRPTGGAGFVPASQVPIPADREAGFIPTVETVKAQFGTPEFVQSAPQTEAAAPQFGLADPTSSTAPTGEDPFAGPIVAPQTPPQADPSQQIRLADPTSSTVGQLTTASGIPLSQFLSGEAIPEAGLVAESPLYSSESRGISGEAGQDIMAQESAARMAGTFSPAGAGRAVSDRERRMATGEETSMADLTDMAKANAPGASPRDIARGQQVANSLGVDLKTGKSLAAQEGLTFDQVMKMKDFDFKRDQEAYKREQDTMTSEGKAAEAFDKDEALLRQVSGDAGRIGRLTNEAIGVTTEIGTTGLAGSILKHVPGTDAHKLDSILEVVSSKVALDRLMEVKKTGATLGQVSEKELAMLQNSYDTLKQGLKGERLREALVNYATQLKAVEDKTAAAFIGKHGQEKFDKIMGGGASGGEPRYANDQDVGGSAESYYNPSASK